MALVDHIQAIVTALSPSGYPVYDMSGDEYRATERSDDVAICVSEESSEWSGQDDSCRVYQVDTEYTATILVHMLSGGDAHKTARLVLDATLPLLSRMKIDGSRPIIRGWNRESEDSLNAARYTITFTFSVYEDLR